MVNRLGKVDEGNTVTDYDEEEIARKHTLSASLAYAEWNKTKVNLHRHAGIRQLLFRRARGDASRRWRAGRRRCRRRRRSADRKGLGGCDETAAAAPGRRQPLDRERASLERTLDSLRLTLNRTIVPISSDRRRKELQRRRRSRRDEGVLRSPPTARAR
jgi:elongation factor G